MGPTQLAPCPWAAPEPPPRVDGSSALPSGPGHVQDRAPQPPTTVPSSGWCGLCRWSAGRWLSQAQGPGEGGQLSLRGAGAQEEAVKGDQGQESRAHRGFPTDLLLCPQRRGRGGPPSVPALPWNNLHHHPKASMTLWLW